MSKRRTLRSSRCLPWSASNWARRSATKLPELIDIVRAAIAKEQRIGAVQCLYEDEAKEGSGNFFAHAGLPREATWEQFRAHYAVGEDDVDADRAFEDLATYPPIAARIEVLKAEQEAAR